MLCVEDLEAEGEPGSAVLPALGPEDPAYILFTSGSTGVPKGVVLTHKNLMGYIGWHVPYYGLGPEDRVPHLAGLSFDASMAEIWPTLCVGGCVLPAPDDDVRLLPEALCRWYTEAGVTVSFLTTQLAEAVLSEPGYPSRMRLRVLFTGGDKLHFGPASHAPFQLVNIYGPTECTVNVTMCLVPPSSGPPSIGQPVPGCQLYVLDQQKRPQPPGVFGDLFVGGPQVGAGYLKRPDLTAQAFVCNPFAHLEAPSSQAGPTLWPSGPCWEGRAGPAHLNQASGTSLVSVRSLELSSAQHGTRLYRTGDLARWTAEGTIDFLGRADCQVKIRGQRIELGEIESKLLQHQAVRECVVVCRKLGNTDDKYLAAYWAAEMGCADDDLDLTAWLKTELPEYMVPKVFVRLTKLPVNANGKVDRKALPEPEFGESGGAQEEQTPESPASSSLEAELRRTFAAVLGRTAKEVPLTASFFSLGGHSLSVGQLVNRIRRDLQIPNACLADVYSHPTVQALAAQLRERQGAKELPTLPAGDASDRGSYPCSFQQLSLYGMAQLDTAASAALNLAFCCHIRGSLDVARLQQAFRALSLRHDALRSTFMTPGLSPDARVTFGDVLCRAETLAAALLGAGGRPDVTPPFGSPGRLPSPGRDRSGSAFSSPGLRPQAAPGTLQESGSFILGDDAENPLVGLMVNPGRWMVAGPLGAWLAGRGYFPLDPGHPAERIQQMVQDARPQYIVCERKHQSVANSLGFPVLLLEDLPQPSRSLSVQRARSWPYLPPEGRGVLIFTSGSTGRPKGVLLSIRALLTHVLFTSKHFGFKPGQAVLQHTSWTFDAPICEIWPALLAGATVVVSKRDGSKDFDYIASLVHEHRVSHALFVPSLLAEILEHQALPRSLRSVMVVGEACSLSLARRILEAPLSLNNFYGPSEGGIGATIYVVDKIGSVPPFVQTLPVGRPVSWRQVLLLDSYFRPAVGRAGQIAILGEGLAIGYLHLPEETKKRFIRTPQAVQDVLPQCGSVMYLTGDVGRYCQDDLLEFVGRLDNQVKLRGQRVELGEVEETLLSAPAVTEAVALVHSDRLIGYFSTLQGVEEGEAVRQCVEKTRQRLPRYMWPELVHITEWPRGRTGKVDRKALPVPTICVQDTVPPRTPLEEKLLSLFCQVLRREPAVTSVHSDFFMLGGTSLRAASLLSALRAMPEASSLQFDELYAHPTVAGLAEILSGNRDVMTLGPAPVDGLMPASLGQEHMLVLQELQPNSPAYNSPLLLRLDGAVDRAALATAIERVIARHDVLRSNLLRDFVDGEHTSGVIQVTTPAAEFSFEAEYWPSADETGQRPLRLKLRPRLLGARLPDRLPDRTETLPDVGGGERASSFNGRVERLGSWFGLGASPRGARTGSWLSPRPSTRSWRNWFFTPPSDRQEASPRGSLRYPNSVQASPGLFMGYASPPVGSPELNPRAHPLLQNSSAVSFQMNEMSSSSCSSVNFLDENGRNGSFRSSNDSVCPMAMSWLQEEVKRPFDLRDDPLIRVVLAKVGQQTHLLLINLHHSVTDGRSLAVLRHELTAAYRATVLKQDLSLPSLSMQYADFAYWQRQWMAQGRLEKQLAYWRVQLQGLPALQLPTDFVRPAVLAPDGGQVAFEVPAAVASQLRSLARAKGSTLFAVLLGLFAATLGRYGDALDLAIASPVANRNGPEVEPLMGYFVNTVIFRAIMQPPCSFEDLLQRLRETVVGAFKNAEAPYAVVLEAAQLDAGSVPAMFVLQDNDEGTWSMENLRVEPIELNRTSALFDVTLEMQELPGTGRGLRGLLVFNTNLWTATRAARFTESFQALAAAVAEQPGAELLSLSALSSADRTRVLEWGGHNQRREAATPLVKALQMQLLQRPQRPAIIDGDLTVSYAEFGVRVAALAAALKKKIRGDKGSAKEGKEEALLGLLLPRSIEMAVSIWACFGAGAAYVPIDPEYPAERISHILSSAMPRLVLCREEDMGLAHGVPVFRTSEWPGKVESADTDYTGLEQPAHSQLAYVIYTSGSTGRPKGVAVEHKSAANMVKEQLNLMQISPEDRVLQFFKPAFDGAVQEYLSTPCGGAALVLWDASKGFGEAMARQRVSAATLTPSALAVLEPSRLPCLSKIAVAAEACPPALIVTWSFEGRRLVNAYGPSEATVVATSADLKACGVLLDNNSFTMEVSPMNVQSQRPRSMSSINSRKAQPHQHVPIGKPLRGVQCYVFEPTMGRCLQPVGAPGELCLGGIQLARGYLGDSAKTTEKFVANPLDGARMYKTGDLVTWLSSGELLYLGRNDEMVKVRGFRVELTEVEAALSNLGAQAVAVGLNANKDALWAWVTPQSLAPQTLRAELLKSLPQYMVPQRIFPLEKLPLTPNGKIDKKRLLADTCAEAADTKSDEDASGQPFVEPQTALEGRLCAAAAGCLGLERLGVTADLKEAGMTSLKAVLLSQKLRDMGLTMPLSAIYELQNIRAMAEHLATQDRDFADDDGDDQDAEESCCCCSVTRVRNCSTGVLRAFTFFCLRICTWIWISGIVTWPAVLPLKFAAAVALPRGGLVCALAWLVLAAYPLYLLFVALLVVLTKWAIVGQYRAGVLELDSFAFLRWWAVDRTVAFVNDLCMGAFRGGPIYFAYLCALGLKARGYCRIDTRHVSEFDLISLGRSCAIAEGAKLRPATAEASLLQLRPMVFGDRCAVGENAVCTAGCVVGQGVTLQPLSLLSGRTGRTLPDGSVWKGSPLVQSRQQPIRVPTGRLSRDLVCDLVALLLALALQLACAGLAHCVFGTLAQAQGFKDSSGGPWQWKQQAEGWLFAATWLLFGPPVMASADVLLGLDLASCADQVASAMGIGQVEFGLRLAGMIVVSFAAYGWALTLGSAMLCRLIRGSRRLNSRLFQVRRLVLRLTFPRYPAQLSGTWAMSLYLRVSGGRVALSATVAVAEPPLEPRKLRVAEGALVLSAQALGECEVGKGSIVGADSVMLPHTEVESGAVVGAMSVVGRPVRADLQLVGNPGVIMHRATLGRRPRTSWARRGIQRVVWMAYPLLAPMLLQLLLLITLLPAMYFLTVLLDTLARNMQSEFGYLLLACLLAPAYVLLGWCLCLVAVLLKWLVIGRVRPDGRFWRWYASCHHHLAMFSQGLNAMSIGVFMGMAMGSPFYNWWLKAMGARVASDALLLTPVVSEHDTLSVGSGAAVDKEAILSSLRLLPVRDSPETVSRFCTSVGRVSVGAGSTVSHGAAVVAAETGDFSVLAPLSAVGPSMRLPPRTLAVGSPPQKFSWSRDRDNLVRPTARPLPRELRPPIRPLPAYVSRAINRIKVVGSGPAGEERLAPLVTGACGFLGRHLVKALLETKGCSRVFAVARASDAAAAQKRVVEALCKAGVTSPHLLELVEAVPGDLSQRNFGRSFAEQQRLAGRVTHVFHSAAKVRPKPFHHISTMGVITPDMLDRHGAVREAAPLGDIRSLPLYGTGDQANGYPQTKWLAEMLVYEAARQGLPAYVHRPGLIGGCSETGAVAQDVFYHFLYDVLQLRRLPAMEGNKFNLTPVDWVAKAIVKIATGPGWVEGESGGGSFASGSSFHPAAPNNSISVEALASVLRRLGYRDVSFMDFVEWRDLILADPIRFKSWSFCAALTSEGDGIDSMADSSRAGAVAMCDAVGKEAFTSFDPKACLERMLRWCAAEGLLPVPEGPEAPSQGRRRATASCNIGEDSV
eukprot:TRINITY_DN13929_c0_g1_i2.p1 TRINITY_DN13929_c0_g1~~TRINITY_DN13929_c0_g1_i2.p1  ORF type:complete len:3884 (-),score=744.81 TRINITY_DN13929_c0_g1_i2:13-11100(-)